MDRRLIACSLLAAAVMAAPSDLEACTNVIVTRGASSDNSNMISYAADSHWLYGELYFHPAKDWDGGSVLKVNDWDTGRYLGNIEQVAHTYKTIGNMNEHQLIIGETTFGGRMELVDPNGKIDYGSLIYITLQRARTAREAISVMAELVNRYGYASEGETFSIADKDEAWIMELVGKGSKGKSSGAVSGAVWVARRIPDGYICAHANQSRITTFPLDDPDNCLYSPDVISFARQKGWYDGPDSGFSFRDAYCPIDFEEVRGCDARAWSAMNILTGGNFTYVDADGQTVTKSANYFLDYVLGYDLEMDMPLWVKPSKKINVKNVADVMRDHFEGTPMDMTQDIGAGGNALPYRWRPMTFEWEGKTYVNERAIATQQTGFWFVAQARHEIPDAIGGILWFGTDDAATSYVTPLYTSVSRVPQCFKEGNGDLLHYSSTSSFWINNRIANACYKMYNYMAPYVRKRIDAFENNQMMRIRDVDSRMMATYRKVLPRANKANRGKENYDPAGDTGRYFTNIANYTTNFSVNTAQGQFKEWKDLEVKLLVKFIDGNVKAEDGAGNFIHSDFSDRIPEGLTQPGYTEYWKEAVSHFHGEAIQVPEK